MQLKQEPGQGSVEKVAHWFAPMACSASLLTQSRTVCPGVTQLMYQISVKTGQPKGGNSSIQVPDSTATLACVQLSETD